ncbi:hypothetical protein FJZ36_15220 [Candidatus Poribacteria bacterium]|nr:hypothetical protein [Candidatus Poribacteria bacterium]
MTADAVTTDVLTRAALKWLSGRSTCVLRERGTPSERADAIGFKLDGSLVLSTLIEVKLTRQDFLADRHKAARLGIGMGVYRYYFAPKGVIAPDELDRWGLVTLVRIKDRYYGPRWSGRVVKVSARFEADHFAEMRALMNEVESARNWSLNRERLIDMERAEWGIRNLPCEARLRNADRRSDGDGVETW